MTPFTAFVPTTHKLYPSRIAGNPMEREQVRDGLTALHEAVWPLNPIQRPLSFEEMMTVFRAVETLTDDFPTTGGRTPVGYNEQLSNLHYWLRQEALAEATRVFGTRYAELELPKLTPDQWLMLCRAAYANYQIIWAKDTHTGKDLLALQQAIHGTIGALKELITMPEAPPMSVSCKSWGMYGPWMTVIDTLTNQLL
ncbi:MAG TPA: hypothetical protein VLA88_03360 [Candidatus Saccharimonadales bacterium]|nr:hypothetical protein [Candidatus Saccharimonadales bacterium]